jgi:hypothetical protein
MATNFQHLYYSIMSTTVKRVAIQRFSCRSSIHNLRKYHSAYRPQYSTETAVSAVFSDIAHAVDTGQICALVLLDPSAASDTVDHGFLMEILEWRFVCRDVVKDWFHSYLTGRTWVYHVGTSVVLIGLT